MPTKTGEQKDVSDMELATTRIFDAPREIVFMAWTAPEYLIRWFGPKGFTCTFHEIDVRPGGKWIFTMHGPDGVDYPNEWQYEAIEAPARIVLRHLESPKFQLIATFDDVGGKTKLTFRQLFDSAEECARVKLFAVEANEQNLDRLGDELARLTNVKEVNLTRVFNAPRALVFKMWTDEANIAKWWGPKGFTNPLCKLDVRPGGAIRIDMRGPDGNVYPMKGVFNKITEPEFLEFTTMAFEDEKGIALLEVRNTVTFAEADGKTTMTLHAKVLKSRPEMVMPLAGMEAGWSQSLDKLAAETSKADR